MTSVRAALFAAVLGVEVVAAFQPLSAQQPPSLAPGQRVRVTAPAAGLYRTVGTLGAVTADSVVLLRERLVHDPRRPFSTPTLVDTVRTAVPRSGLQTVEVLVGRRRHTWAGLGIGLTFGAVFGASQPCNAFCAPGENLAGGAFLGGLLGTIVGAIIRTDIWEPVPPHRPRLGMTPLPAARLGFGASLAF